MKIKDKKIKVYIDLFNHTIEVIFTKNPYFYRNVTLLKKHPQLGQYNKDFEAVCTHDNFMGKAWCIVPNNCKVDLVVHEVNHAVDDMVEMYGLQGTEIKSYLLQYVLKKVYGKTNRVRKQK